MKNIGITVTVVSEMIEAAKVVIECRRLISEIEPTVRRIQRDLLIDTNAKDEEGCIICEPELMYLIAEETVEEFYRKLDIEYKKAGFDIEPGCCPLLMAEEAERKAVRAMNKAAEPLFDNTINSEEIYNLELYKRLTELNLRYIKQFIK